MARRYRAEELSLHIPPGFTPLPRPPEDGPPGGGEGGGNLVEWAIRGPHWLVDHTETLVLQWNDRVPAWSVMTHLARHRRYHSQLLVTQRKPHFCPRFVRWNSKHPSQAHHTSNTALAASLPLSPAPSPPPTQVAFPEAWGPESPDRNNRVQQIQVRGRWQAPMRMPTRVLRVSPKLLTDTLAMADPGGDGTRPLRQLLKSLVVMAAVLVRVPVIPSVECSRLSWIGEEAWVMGNNKGQGYGRLGVNDKRVLVYQREVATVVRERRMRGVPSPAAAGAARADQSDAEDADADDEGLLGGHGWDWERTVEAMRERGASWAEDGDAGEVRQRRALLEGSSPEGASAEPPVMCAPYFSAGDRCLDPVILSDFYLDQDLLYPSYTQGTLDVTEGIDPEHDAYKGNYVERVLKVAREGQEARHRDTRVLWMEGDARSVLRVSNETTSLLAALTYEEKRFLDEFYEWCGSGGRIRLPAPFASACRRCRHSETVISADLLTPAKSSAGAATTTRIRKRS